MKLVIFFAMIIFSVDALALPTARLGEVSYAGTGCPAGSARVEALPMPNWFAARFDHFAAVAGAKARLSDGRKICQMVVNLGSVPGHQFSIDGIWLLGVALDLKDRDEALIKVGSYVQGQVNDQSTERKFNGPKKWRGQLDLHPAEAWSPCGEARALIVNIQLRAKSAKGRSGQEASAKLDDMAKFRVKWRPCQST